MPFIPARSTFVLLLVFLSGCVPISQLPPPERPGFNGVSYGVAAVAPQPLSPVLGLQAWGMKSVGVNHTVGARIANLNTPIISTIGGGVFYRKAMSNTRRRYAGWETELGTGYLRFSSLNAMRKDKWQYFFSPGIQIQPNISLLQIHLPIGITFWKTDKVAISGELSSSLYFWDLFDGEVTARINPTIGVEF